MGRIRFTDSTGPATLDNGLATIAGGVAARFRGWTPFVVPIGPVRTALGTGARYQFAFRTDYGARFRLEEIPTTSLPAALRLQAHLLGGGTVAVETDDSEGRTYETCGLAPDTEPMLEFVDAVNQLYAFSVSLINLAASPEAMLCEYGPIVTPATVLLVAAPDRLPDATFVRASTATYAAAD